MDLEELELAISKVLSNIDDLSYRTCIDSIINLVEKYVESMEDIRI